MKTADKSGALFWIFVILSVIWALTSCTKTLYIPVNSVKTEYRDNYLRDSVYSHDSIFLKVKGDTVWFEKYEYIYREKLIKDSIFINDTIKIPYPVEVIKEVNKLYKWQYYLMFAGVLSIMILGIWLFVKFKHKF